MFGPIWMQAGQDAPTALVARDDKLQLSADIVQTSLSILLAFCTINTISLRIPLPGMRKINNRSRHHRTFPVQGT